MVSRDFVFWEVDCQEDFIIPGGKLYVPGAERLLPTIRRLTDAARQDQVFLASHGDFHAPDDPEFKIFPPHCVKGTPGAEFVPEALADKVLSIENDPGASIPEDLSRFQQIILEKQTLDVFDTRHASALLERLPHVAEFVVFGVATEYCVRLAAKGLLQRKRRVAVVQDAIEALQPEAGRTACSQLRNLGARMITADQALAALTQVNA